MLQAISSKSHHSHLKRGSLGTRERNETDQALGKNTTKSQAVLKTHKSHKGLLESYISTKNFWGDGTFGQAELPVSHTGSPRDAAVLSHHPCWGALSGAAAARESRMLL